MTWAHGKKTGKPPIEIGYYTVICKESKLVSYIFNDIINEHKYHRAKALVHNHKGDLEQ